MINVQTPIMCRRRTNKEGGSKPQTTLFNGPLSTKSCHCFHEKCLCLALVFILNVVILKLPLKNDCNNRTALFLPAHQEDFLWDSIDIVWKGGNEGEKNVPILKNTHTHKSKSACQLFGKNMVVWKSSLKEELECARLVPN